MHFRIILFLKIFFWLHWVFVALWITLVASSAPLLFIVLCRLLIAVTSLVVEHGLWVHGLP